MVLNLKYLSVYGKFINIAPFQNLTQNISSLA